MLEQKAIGFLSMAANFTVDPTDTAFTQVLNRVMFDATLSMGARLTYAALVEHNRDNLSCWPSMERLGSMVGVCARTIQNYIRELVSKGLVTVLKRGYWRRANEYRLEAVVPPVAAKESQPHSVEDMRNQARRVMANRTAAQLYPTNNRSSSKVNSWKRVANEAGAKAFIQRQLARQASKNR